MEDTIIKALLLGYAHIECNGTPIRICLTDCHRLLQRLVQHIMRSSRVPLSSTFPSSSLVLYSR